MNVHRNKSTRRRHSTLCAVLLLCAAGCANTPRDVVAPGTAPTSGIPATIVSIDNAAVGYESAVPLVPRTTTSTSPAAPVWQPAPSSSSWPAWRVSNEGVPYYSGNVACSPRVAFIIADQFIQRGASQATAWWAVYVASREGNCEYTAVHVGPTDNSHCFFQLNAKGGGPLSSGGVLGKQGWTTTNVKVSESSCAQAGAALWAACGKGPWIRGDYGCKPPTN